MHRRHLLHFAAALAAPALSSAQARPTGRLLIIGGAEDRVRDRVILKKFASLCGGPDARIKLILAASSEPESVWHSYQGVFADLGLQHCEAIPLSSREAAFAPEVVDMIHQADGIFMTGGDQGRLMSCLWETPAAAAIHRAFHVRGCTIAGTSAGAAVMSRQMIAQGSATPLPEKDTVSFDIGLGLVPRAIVDQHFSQRRRLGRLLSALAQRPDMLGVGIDEDTALIIERNQAIEIVGQGAVTLIDGRKMHSNFEDIEARERLEMHGVSLHLLPAGNRYSVARSVRSMRRLHPALLDALNLLVAPGPMRG